MGRRPPGSPRHRSAGTLLTSSSEPVSKWGGHQAAELPGSQLVQRHLDGDRTYPWMGRGDGGLFGPQVAHDVETGGWRTHRYQCAGNEVVNNRNWFAFADFVNLLRGSGQVPTSTTDDTSP